MDPKLIREKQLVERWLIGKLTPPEARFFEQMVRNTPGLADTLGLPESLRRTMKLLDETGNEWREQQPKPWHNPMVPIGLAAALALAIALAIGGWVSKAQLSGRYDALKQEATKGTLGVPSNTTLSRLAPVRGEVGALPVAVLGGRDTPALAELHVDVGLVKASLYQLTIKSGDGTFWARIDNLLRDSNGDLRIAFNSSAFAAGEYLLEVRAVNLRGEGDLVGRLRLKVEPR